MPFAESKRTKKETFVSPKVSPNKNDTHGSQLQIIDPNARPNIIYDASGPAGLTAAAPIRKQASVVEMLEYVKGLDIDPLKEADMLWIAEEAFNAPLPPGWSEHQDDKGRLYFHNIATGKSEWRHPMDDVFREVVTYQRRVIADDGFWNVEDEIAGREEAIRRDLADWMELFDENTEKFFYNRRTDESRFDDPRMEKYHELYARIKMIAKMKERLPQLARNSRPKEPTAEELEAMSRAREEEERYLKMLIRIQSMARVIIARKKVKHAVAQAVVQKGPQPLKGKLRLRMERVGGAGRKELVLAQTTPHRRHKAATKIQARCRGIVARKRFRPLVLHRHHLSKVVTKVQNRVRIWIARRRVARMRLARKVRAATICQRMFRGYKDRKFLKGLTIEKKRFNFMVKKVVTIQSGARMKLAKMRVERIRNERKHRMVSLMKAKARSFLAQRKLNDLKSIAYPVLFRIALTKDKDTVDFAPFHCQLLCAPVAEDRLVAKGNFTDLFSNLDPEKEIDYVGKGSMKKVKMKQCHEQAVVKAQAMARGALTRGHKKERLAYCQGLAKKVEADALDMYIERRLAATRIQKIVRGVQVRKKDLITMRMKKFLERNVAKIKLVQGYCRRSLAQQWLKFALHGDKKTKAATVIQARWRGCLARANYKRLCDEVYWPVKSWFEFNSGKAFVDGKTRDTVEMQVRFVANPRFDDFKHFAEYGDCDDLFHTVKDMTEEVGFCVEEFLATELSKPSQPVAKKEVPVVVPALTSMTSIATASSKSQPASLNSTAKSLNSTAKPSKPRSPAAKSPKPRSKSPSKSPQVSARQDSSKAIIDSSKLAKPKPKAGGRSSSKSSNQEREVTPNISRSTSKGVAPNVVRSTSKPSGGNSKDNESKLAMPKAKASGRSSSKSSNQDNRNNEDVKYDRAPSPAALEVTMSKPKPNTPAAMVETSQVKVPRSEVKVPSKGQEDEVPLEESSTMLPGDSSLSLTIGMQTMPTLAQAITTPQVKTPETQPVQAAKRSVSPTPQPQSSFESKKESGRQSPGDYGSSKTSLAQATDTTTNETRRAPESKEKAARRAAEPSMARESYSDKPVDAPRKLHHAKEPHHSPEREDRVERELPPVIAPVRKMSPIVTEPPLRKPLFQAPLESESLKLFKEAPKKYKDKEPAGCPVAARRKEYDDFKEQKRHAQHLENLEMWKAMRGRSESPPKPPGSTAPAPPTEAPNSNEIKAAQLKLSQSDGALQNAKPLPAAVRKTYGGKLVGGTFVKSNAETVHDMTEAEIKECQADIARLDAAKREELAKRTKEHAKNKKKEEKRKQDKFLGDMGEAEALEEERRKRKVKELKKWLKEKEGQARAKKEREDAMMQEVLQKEQMKADAFKEIEKKRVEEREKRLRIGEIQKAKLEAQMMLARGDQPRSLIVEPASKIQTPTMSQAELAPQQNMGMPPGGPVAMQPLKPGAMPQFHDQALEQRVVHRHIHHHVHYHEGAEADGQTSGGNLQGAPALSLDQQKQLEMTSEARVRSQLEQAGPLQLGRNQSEHMHQHVGMARMEVDPGAETPTNSRRAMSIGAPMDGSDRTQEAFYRARPLGDEAGKRGLERYAGNVNRAFGSYADSGRPRLAQHLPMSKPAQLGH